MATGVEATETGGAAGIALEFPMNDLSPSSSCSSSPPPPKIPRRIKQRLMEFRSPSATTAEEIEAKLREADLRRQQFHEWLSTKARPKPRSPSWSSSQDDDPGQRLEAKLHAAEQKRLSILAKSKKRLARLDEIRQAAKTGVEMRFESKREELGSKVESRVQQAEANRLLLLKAHRQRRAVEKERTAKSLLQRMAQEKKYKERVRAAIYQKRAAAEKKRLVLLEAEKTRVHARVVQVQQVANSVNHQRETERRKIKDQLEYRLQRARRQRAEYLRQRGNLHSIIRSKTDRQGEILSRKLARCWRRFMRSRRTTFSLVKDHEALGINETFVKVMPFEQLALRIESAENLQTVKALLDRLEYRLVLSQAATVGASKSSNLSDIDHLLQRLASPKRRSPRDSAMKGRAIKKTGPSREGSQNQAKLSRYPVRVFLCAYMILGHPDAVFNGQGEREITLSQSASDLVHEFELLINIILDGSSLNTEQLSANMSSSRRKFRTQLQSFDAAWCSYLYNFVVWKVKDARSLEEDLVRAACQLELSMMQTCKLKAEGDIDSLSHDMKAIQKQVMEDQRLLRENVQRLSGEAGIERMECALSDARSRFFEAKENGASPPIAHISSPNPPSSSPGSFSATVSKERSLAGDNENTAGERRRGVARSLFGKDDSSQLKKHGLSTSSSNVGGLLGSSAEKLLMENELLVNEIVHDFHHSITNSFSTSDDDRNGIKAQIRATMEKAFWDGIAETLKEDKPDYSHVIELMKEVKDELCEMAPQNWREDIVNAIDLEILSQILSSGNLDMECFGKILDFSLATLRKLSALDKENEMMNAHKQLMDELYEISRDKSKLNVSFIVAMIKGLRFVLEQIQDLKREISKARIRMIEPFIKGPAGLDYLGKAFADHYGQPESASTSLPLTRSWLPLVWHTAEQEWNEHLDSLSVQTTTHGSSIHGFPLTTLRAGGIVPMASNQSHGISSSATTGNLLLECTGEKVDVLVRLGLLNLVTAIEGLTQGTLPETLKLNFSRLRAVQAQLQKVVVMSISMLIFRQILVIEKVASSPAEMETIASRFVEQLNDLLDSVEDVGIKEVVEIMNQLSSSEGASTLKEEQLQSREQMMSNLLGKSLQVGDPVFTKVSRAIYLALRAILFGGTGPRGKELSETALRKVGAAALLEKVMEGGEVLCMVATVSNQVHGSWYREVINGWN
ncbi:hypothetical protein Syun_014000 [Stephania yunnanensis]|uniref:T-complex protein 11 n=1 Tax=Stephania yunnanensis TaxID=152371 RepID=A0AAP0JKL1_9MAGN